MKYIKHWKLELFITILAALIIPLIYLLFSPFFGQILFVPLIFGILPIFLIKRYKLLFCYPFGVSLVYTILLLILNWSWPLDWSLIPLAFGTILVPTSLGYIIAILSLEFLDPSHKWVIPIHCLSSILIVYVVVIHSLYISSNSLLANLSVYLFLPLTFIGTQTLISYLYPSNRLSPLVNALIFQISFGFTGRGYFSFFTILYLALAYATMYLVVTRIKKQQFP